LFCQLCRQEIRAQQARFNKQLCSHGLGKKWKYYDLILIVKSYSISRIRVVCFCER
jgi:hypothetical protein